MNLGVLVDVCLGILAIMILFSLVASAINELILDNLANLRGTTLEKAIGQMLEAKGMNDTDGKKAVDEFYEQPGIRSLMNERMLVSKWTERIVNMFRSGDKKRTVRDKRLPSAMEPRRYAETILAMHRDRGQFAETAQEEIKEASRLFEQFVAGASELLNEEERGAALAKAFDEAADKAAALAKRADAPIEEQIQRLEKEYEEMMARVSGWYLRNTRLMLFAIGMVLAVGANVDLLHYGKRMMTEANIAEKAQTANLLVESWAIRQSNDNDTGESASVEPPSADEFRKEIDTLFEGLAELDVRVGWTEITIGWSQFTSWILIAFGVTLGAQFWVDLFKKVVSLRSAGKTASSAVSTDQKPASA